MEVIDARASALKELVERFRVCWEVWPEEIVVGSRRQIGYSLELIGTHESGISHPEAGCEHCQHVFAALREIAQWILPPEGRPSMYEIAPFDQAIRYSPARGNRPDVTLTIKILHREGFDRPIDECEDRCLKEMEDRLRELGASGVRWSPGKRSS